MEKKIIISLGGSLIVPDDFDTKFLSEFKKLIESYLKKGFKFVIICGGGKTARKIQNAAKKIAKVDSEDLDWLGIYATKLNAALVWTAFKKDVEEVVIDNPNKKLSLRKIAIAGGWKPGCSTDYDAILLAKNLNVKKVINMSNVDYVYTKDPRIDKSAEKIEEISWVSFRKMVGSKWSAGMNVPFDPIAAKSAQKLKIEVNIIGKDLKNLKNLLDGREFKGTTIRG
ncbi:MAG TPA: UMP kinase [Candidatus Nanoarchaeia archaeon]|nr:UMP kinase [Candidatus Nanoarchaeia archaeon]